MYFLLYIIAAAPIPEPHYQLQPQDPFLTSLPTSLLSCIHKRSIFWSTILLTSISRSNIFNKVIFQSGTQTLPNLCSRVTFIPPYSPLISTKHPGFIKQKPKLLFKDVLIFFVSPTLLWEMTFLILPTTSKHVWIPGTHSTRPKSMPSPPRSLSFSPQAAHGTSLSSFFFPPRNIYCVTIKC